MPALDAAPNPRAAALPALGFCALSMLFGPQDLPIDAIVASALLKNAMAARKGQQVSLKPQPHYILYAIAG